MARTRSTFRCTECGGAAPRWAGRCPACAAWNTLVEELDVVAGGGGVATRPADAPRPIAEVDPLAAAPRPTGVGELDRVLGGGLVPGSVTLVGGEPGVGKSTLLLQVLAAVARGGHRALYVTGEESVQQVRARAERLGALAPSLWLVSATELPHVLAHVDEVEPDLLVVDSVQTLAEPELASAPGSVAQVRECAHRLVRLAKARQLTTVLVGHVTKDGALAGPRVLEHVVDTVLAVEGDRHHALRLVRATKHRFGATDELGVFEMVEEGLRGVDDPSELFLADRRPGLPGSVVLPTLEGQRPLLVELQALVAGGVPGSPRRSAQGVDPGRLALLLAVLDRRAGVGVADAEVYALAVGGVRVTEPGADLALALAVASAALDRPLPADLVAVGEVGLGGELRQAARTERRLIEAARLGFGLAVVPTSAPAPPPGLTLLRAGSLVEAVAQLLGDRVVDVLGPAGPRAAPFRRPGGHGRGE